jgi:hypothetical protein
MGQLEDILKHQNMVLNNIMKSFGAETSEDRTNGSYSGDTSKSRIDDLMKKLGKENLKKLKRISLTESYD